MIPSLKNSVDQFKTANPPPPPPPPPPKKKKKKKKTTHTYLIFFNTKHTRIHTMWKQKRVCAHLKETEAIFFWGWSILQLFREIFGKTLTYLYFLLNADVPSDSNKWTILNSPLQGSTSHGFLLFAPVNLSHGSLNKVGRKQQRKPVFKRTKCGGEGAGG